MTRHRVAPWVWLLFAISAAFAWRPLLDQDLREAARHSSELPDAAQWEALAEQLPEDAGVQEPLFVLAMHSAEFVWLRFLAYPHRLAALPRQLNPASLRRVLPAGRALILLLHAAEPERALRQFGERTAPRVPVLRGRHAEHLLVDLPP